MKRYIALLILGVLIGACHDVGTGGPSLGAPDLGGSDDQSINDLAVMNLTSPWSTLSLVAGGLGGAGNGDGTGAAARFLFPYGVAADGAGNVFVASPLHHTIRKVVVATGEVTTLAGVAGVSGSIDGFGADARLFNPTGLAADGAGNVFVADTNNHTIRKLVVATGAVTTLAGTAGMRGSVDGTGPAALFYLPGSLALDGAGNLFVVESSSHTIRKVVVATGVVTTLVGTAGIPGSADGTGPAARFNFPGGVAVDGAGNLLVADEGNYTIRKVVVATASVSTLAGTAGMQGSTDGTGPAARFRSPRGAAVDGVGNLFVSDASNYTIRKLVVATGAVTTLAGTAGMQASADGTGPAARFSAPNGVAVDGLGNLFVADLGNCTIRKVEVVTGAVTTLAGASAMFGSTDGTGPTARFNSPGGVAVDGAGDLFVADTSNNTIRKVEVATGAVTSLAGIRGQPGSTDGTGPAARFSSPRGVAADGAGNLFIADVGNNTIRKVEVVTGVVTTLAGTAGLAGSTNGTGPAARFNGPAGVAADGAGNLFVSDIGNYTIRKVVVATGVVTTIAGAAGASGIADGTGSDARFSSPNGVALDGEGNLFVADTNAHTIRKVVVATGRVTTLASTAGRIGSTNGTGPAARFYYPRGVAVDGSGNLFVADSGNNAIRKIQISNASVTTLIGVSGQIGVLPGLLPARLNAPQAVAASPSGALFILDENSVLSVR